MPRICTPFVLAALAALFASNVCAQAASVATVDNGCPTLPVDSNGLHWTSLRTESALLCRALRDDGREAFALTMTQKVGFRLESQAREEQGRIQGRKVWWHRSEIAGQPNEVVRETLVKLDSDRIAHIYIRSENAAEVAQYQQLVQSLQFATADIASR
jgi:hypothetical protein